MNNVSKNYFSAGEFAKLFKVSKQTLFYYERNKILEPVLIEDNGYRYYSLEQYFIFDIIINLRKLGFPLKDIADYIKNRSIDKLQSIYQFKQEQYLKEIEIMQRNINNLQIKINRLEKAKNINIDKITLEEYPGEYYLATPFLGEQFSLKEKIKLVAQHNYPFATSDILNEYLMGYILPHDQLLKKNFLNISHIYTRVSHPDEYTNIMEKKAGIYACIYTTNGFHIQYHQGFKKLMSFIELNHLEIIGDAFIEHIRNYWSTDNYDEYITKLMIPISYK